MKYKIEQMISKDLEAGAKNPRPFFRGSQTWSGKSLD